jgi:hypothetical protein
MTIAAKNLKPVNLYWATTEDNSEDWFFLARSARSAAKAHVNEEGFEPGSASAELILSDVGILVSCQGQTPPCWAQIPELTRLGFKVLPSAQGIRKVELDGRVFEEGTAQCMLDLALKVRDGMHVSRGNA